MRRLFVGGLLFSFSIVAAPGCGGEVEVCSNASDGEEVLVEGIRMVRRSVTVEASKVDRRTTIVMFSDTLDACVARDRAPKGVTTTLFFNVTGAAVDRFSVQDRRLERTDGQASVTLETHRDNDKSEDYRRVSGVDGFINVTAFTPDERIGGDYDVTFESGERITGHFDATFCASQIDRCK